MNYVYLSYLIGMKKIYHIKHEGYYWIENFERILFSNDIQK
jgi:hypothetical protein